MINKEEYRHEENNHGYLEEWIHWITKINDTRLYWLWMRFVITAGASAEGMGFSNALPVLNTMKPVTDILSWSLFGGRLVMQSILVMQPTLSTVEVTPTSVTKVSCLNDFLWGTSNFLSAQWLHGNELRPPVGALDWWGNLFMEVLLIYDVIFAAWLCRHEQHQVNGLTMPSNERQLQWQYRKQALLNNLVYTTILACGFLLFRGFSTQINGTVPPYVGAGLCAVSTVLFRAIEWAMMLSKFKNKPCSITPNTVEFQQHQHAFQQTCVGASVSVGLDLLLPLFIWMSSDANNMILVIALSLSINIFINGCFKRDKASPLSRCSLFAPQSSRVSPGSSELPQLSLA
jgi:hypothetical protein